MAGGRPTDYTEELGDLICEGISNRMSLVKICAGEDMPAVRTVYNWLRTHEEFLHNYETAKEDQAHALVEKALEIADDEMIDPQHKRIMVDTRKWIASKYNTKKYGDKQVVENKHTYTQLSGDELDHRIKALENELKAED